MPDNPTPDPVKRNVVLHNRIANLYDDWHPEIFTEVEQTRLRAALEEAAAATGKSPDRIAAMDLGCGSGNVTRHLVEMGFCVTATDVADNFLTLVEKRWGATGRLRTVLLNGEDFHSIPEGSFDLITAYSVLHHLPDYLATLADLVPLLRPGGVIYLDHEVTDAYWQNDPVYAEFTSKANRPEPAVKDRLRFLKPAKYLRKLRELYYKRAAEDLGDIHTWPEDHIEWERVEARLRDEGLSVVFSRDYLLFREYYLPEVYEAYRDRCSDVHVLAMRLG
ncbi:MAG TPA: methyltransferase domain-containing protein [Coriobacteriia bacterium]|jgi:2-polyprenyl-3-methyl-5-hydroxy-6-metoxy-1,4-benzoquinol methylase